MYMIFAGNDYYPAGGWNDYKGSFDTLQECLECLVNLPKFDWWHVVQDGHIIKSGKVD